MSRPILTTSQVTLMGGEGGAAMIGKMDSAPGEATSRRFGHVPALDGLRALAIVAVMLFHFPTRAVVMGGLFGVDVFFALSGFLVTALLLSEFSTSRRIDLRSFLGRRAWRLIPALMTFLTLYLLADALFGRTTWFASQPGSTGPGPSISFTEALRGVTAAATYTFNIFRSWKWALPPIGHLWSLSVEGQFYLLWPVVVVVLLRRAPQWLFPATMILAGVSAVSPWLLWNGGRGETLIYYSTLTRMQGLLIGAIGAQLWYSGAVSRTPRRIRSLLCAGALAVLAYLFFGVANVPFKYLGALTVAPAASIVIVLHLAEDWLPQHRQGVVAWGLSRPAIIWLGERSYALYLWHYLFVCWTNRLPHDIGVPLGIVVSLVAAELSWRLIEAPAQSWARHRRAAKRSRRGGEIAEASPI
jgi:peptidoglycan/LPS O-acetylase OafA/YrhL